MAKKNYRYKGLIILILMLFVSNVAYADHYYVSSTIRYEDDTKKDYFSEIQMQHLSKLALKENMLISSRGYSWKEDSLYRFDDEMNLLSNIKIDSILKRGLPILIKRDKIKNSDSWITRFNVEEGKREFVLTLFCNVQDIVDFFDSKLALISLRMTGMDGFQKWIGHGRIAWLIDEGALLFQVINLRSGSSKINLVKSRSY